MVDASLSGIFRSFLTKIEKLRSEKTSEFRAKSVEEIENIVSNQPIRLTDQGRAYAVVISPDDYEKILQIISGKIDVEKHFENNADIINVTLFQEFTSRMPEKTGQFLSIVSDHHLLKSEVALQMANIDAIANAPDTDPAIAQSITHFKQLLHAKLNDQSEKIRHLLESANIDMRKAAIMRQINPHEAASAAGIIENIIAAADHGGSQEGQNHDRRETQSRAIATADGKEILP